MKRPRPGHGAAWLALLSFVLAATPPWPPPPTEQSSASAVVLGLDGAALGSPVGSSFSPGSRGWKRSDVFAVDLPGAAAVGLAQQRVLPGPGESRGPACLPEPPTVLRV